MSRQDLALAILRVLQSSTEALTASEILDELKQHYFHEQLTRSDVNSVLYKELKTSGKVKTDASFSWQVTDLQPTTNAQVDPSLQAMPAVPKEMLTAERRILRDQETQTQVSAVAVTVLAQPTLNARSASLRFPQLRPASSAEEYALHIAALEWSLDAPITIRGEADIQSKREWADRFEPFAHQIRNLITFCRRAPVALLADDVGLGKTISAGLILSELMVRKKLSRALVVAPKLLLSQWCEELGVKFGIPATSASGADLLTALKRNMPVVVTTYHSIRNHLPHLRHANLDMLILDEAHKLRNLHGTSKPPGFAVGIRQALADRVFKYVLMLTATPIQNRLWDLYSLIDLLTVAKGHTNPLGLPELFKAKYIEDSRAVQIKRGRREEFRQHLSNYIVRTRRSDAKLVFPTRRVRTFKVNASKTEVELLNLVRELFLNHTLNGLTQSSIGQALMSSPEALTTQLNQMASHGTVPAIMASRASALLNNQETTGKLEGLLQLLRELSSKRPDHWRVVIFTSRVQTLEAIGRELAKHNMKVGYISGSRTRENEPAIHGFRESPPRHNVLISTDTGAEGLNLQIANVLVNYDLPWNPMLLEQRIGRVQRLASTHGEVTVLNLVLAGSVEEHVVGRLGEKLQVISESIGDIEGILESASSGTADEDSFETMIRKLVVDSLKGMDVQRATQQAIKSIEEAKQIFEEEKETVEKTLGDLKDLHRVGPRVPEIAPVIPSIDAKEFVLRSLHKDGGLIESIDDDLYSVTMPGYNAYRIVFKDRELNGSSENNGFFGSNAPKLYLPGKRDFERLAQSWTDKAGAFISDRTRITDEELETHLKAWLTQFPGFSLSDFEIASRQSGFMGKLTCRGSVAVSHDRLEKLVDIPISPQHPYQIAPEQETDRLSTSTFDTDQLGNQYHELVSQGIRNEPDLKKFCDFYERRLKEELPAATTNEEQRRVREQFTPVTAGDAVSVKGVKYAVLKVRAQLRIDQEGPYIAEFLVIPGGPAQTEIQYVTEWVGCQYTQRKIPISAVDSCEHCGLKVLRHLMIPSAMSGKLALPDHMQKCDVTGDSLLAVEMGVCGITGKRVRRDLLASSALSGDLAISDQLQTCEVTGVKLLPSELIVSDISARKYRRDQTVESILSGRQGHASEFVSADLPAGWLAKDEALASDVSGKWGHSERMVRSQLAPFRCGLPSEAIQSAATGMTYLLDEVKHSDIGGGSALPSELVICELTGASTLPGELQISEVSGKKYRCDQTSKSIISGKTGHQSEFVQSDDPTGLLAMDEAGQSEASGRWALKERLVRSDLPPHREVLADELLVSVISGKRALPQEICRSALSGALALPEELETCQFTGAAVLPGELCISQISAKPYRMDEACESVYSGRKGHKSEFVQSILPVGLIAVDEAARSDVSGKTAAKTRLVVSEAPSHRLGLPEEMIKSAVSGRHFLPDEITRSAISGAPAYPAELIICDVTGVQAMPSELLQSEISGKRFRMDEKMVSTLSGRFGHCSEFIRSVSPTGWLACDEAQQSEVSQEWGASKNIVLSTKPPYRRGLPHEAVTCEITGQRLLCDEVGRSAVSGKVVDKTLLVASAAGGDLAIPEEMVVCEITHARLLPNECNRCNITGKLVDRRQLTSSAISGLPGISSMMARCSQSGTTVLPSELQRCEVTGELALSKYMVTCSISNRLGLQKHLRQCPTTERWYIDDENSRNRVASLTGSKAILGRCQWSGKSVVAISLKRCILSGLTVIESSLNGDGELASFRDLLDGKRVDGTMLMSESELVQLRSTSPKLKLAREAHALKCPSQDYVVAVVRTKPGFFGFGAYLFAVTIECAVPIILTSEPLPGLRQNNVWVQQT